MEKIYMSSDLGIGSGRVFAGRLDRIREKFGGEVVYLPRTLGVSTTELISKCSQSPLL